MKIVIEPVTGCEDKAAVLRIRQQVFEREMGLTLEPPEGSDGGDVLHLLARVGPGGEPAGALCVIDTSGSHRLHEDYGLRFDPEARVARYRHLAVLEPYRGRNIPMMMMLEAHRRFVTPGQFDYSWLLFNAERAPGSFLCNALGFNRTPNTFLSSYGRRCPLVRDERDRRAQQAIRQAEQYVRRFSGTFPREEVTSAPPAPQWPAQPTFDADLAGSSRRLVLIN